MKNTDNKRISSVVARATLFSSVLLACGMAGCVNAPTPKSHSESWVPPKDSQKPDTVWQEIRTRKPDLEKPLSLLGLVDLALENNPTTAKSWNEARAAAEQVRYAEGYFMPSINAVVGASRVKVSADPESFDESKLAYGPGLQLSYLVCNFGGGRHAAVEQALQTVYAANFAFNRAIQDTLLSVEVAYYGVVSAQAGVDAAATNSLDAKVILDATQERRDAGLGVDLEVLQAQVGYDQSLFALASAEGQKKMADGLLAHALHLPADTQINVVQPETALPASLSGQDVRLLIDEALARRPDISAMRASLAANEYAIRVARASRWPSLYLNGSVANDYFELYGENSRGSADTDWAYTGGVSLKWNLFDGLQTLSSVRTAEARADAMRAQLSQAELGASTEIWASFQKYETALKKYQFSSMALKSATASREMAFESYNAGVKTLLDLLSAETQLAQARAQNIAVKQEVFTALAYLTHVTGLIEKGHKGIQAQK
jgi:outer membrane protein TolC